MMHEQVGEPGGKLSQNNRNTINTSRHIDEDIKKLEERKYLPKTAYIQLSAKCNLKCLMCGYAGWKGKRKDMDVEFFEIILNELKKSGIKRVCLFGAYGESMLHPNFFRMINMANKKGMSIVLNTNGTLLNKENIKRLVEMDIFNLQFSFAGYNKESYEQVYRGGIFEKVTENLFMLNDTIKTARAATFLEVNSVLINDDKEFSEKCKRYLIKNGLKENQILIKLAGNYGGRKKLGKRLNGVYSFKNTSMDNTIHTIRENIKICPFLIKTIGVYSDGTVTACGCVDNEGFLKIGSIKNETIFSMRNGKRYQNMLEKFISRDLKGLVLCERCDMQYGSKVFSSVFPMKGDATTNYSL